eukprot:scaffold62713_cov29-Tisochrysis_lutea.AAC.3
MHNRKATRILRIARWPHKAHETTRRSGDRNNTDGTNQKFKRPSWMEHASETGPVVVYQGRTPDTKEKGKRGGRLGGGATGEKGDDGRGGSSGTNANAQMFLSKPTALSTFKNFFSQLH